MPINQKNATYDNLLLLKDAVAVTASGNATVAAVARILDLGLSRTDFRVIADVSAIKTSATDESYRVRVQVSTSSTFASGVVSLGAIELGAPSVTGNTIASAIGRYELAGSNEINGVIYRFIRMSFVVAGTAPTITHSAYLVKDA